MFATRQAPSVNGQAAASPETVPVRQVRLADLPPEDLEKLRWGIVAMLGALGLAWHDAEEIAQDALLKWHQAGPLTSPKAWLRAVARQDGQAMWRKQRDRGAKLGRKVGLDQAEVGVDMFEETSASETREVVRAAVCRLPWDQSCVVELLLNGVSLKAIAKELGIHENTARKRVESARAKLQEWLSGSR